MEIKPIAKIYNDFTDKFAIPRQSGLAGIESEIVFEKEYALPEAVKGLAGYSHLWLIWGFSENVREKQSLTVRPPRLGGNEKVGVFASRSPFRPNNLGLSCVKLEEVRIGALLVSGADLKCGTPIYDIKPYIPYSDSIPDAKGGFTDTNAFPQLEVIIPDAVKAQTNFDKWDMLQQILQNDPRPAYHHDDTRRYGFGFGGYDVRFTVKDGVLTVTEITNE